MDTIRGDRKKGNSGLTLFFLFFCMITIFLTGCATTGGSSSQMTEVLTIEKTIEVHLYYDIEKMRSAYMIQGGRRGIAGRLLGFYSERDNTIHCMKWDFDTCGHELFHALQYNAAPTLLADKDHEHFKGQNYTNVTTE